MINKIFVWLGLALAAILIVENMVTGLQAYVFVMSGAGTWLLALVSTIVGAFIGYWLRGMLESDSWDDENYDF